jgi:hypothetical protein
LLSLAGPQLDKFQVQRFVLIAQPLHPNEQRLSLGMDMLNHLH